jgi:hypothetical protein
MSSSAVSLLNEYCQQKQLPTPEYNTLTTDGPSHMPVFTMRVVVDEREFVATGANKKAAKCKCAAKAVQELDVDQYFKDRMKVYKYRICELDVVDKTDTSATTSSLEVVWNEEVEEVVLVIKRFNELDEHELKTIKLRVLK